MKRRLVIPEILDSLAADDPRALRSRRDLALINAVMGNYRWLAARVATLHRAVPHDWVEIGAGDGPLARVVAAKKVPGIVVAGHDLAPRPARWPVAWPWVEGDLFETLGGPGAGGGSRPRAVLASLFLHHLDTPELGRLGGLIEAGFDRVLCVEPARYRWFRCLGHAFFPFVNAVTRHDLQVSIGAGFRRDEIRASLGLGAGWAVRETLSPLGAYRFEAWRP